MKLTFLGATGTVTGSKYLRTREFTPIDFVNVQQLQA
jgi:hypothetical protein